MRLLILDAGNTRVSAAVWEGPHQGPSPELATEPALASAVPLKEAGPIAHPVGEGPEAFRESLVRAHAAAACQAIVLATVVPGVDKLLPTGVRVEIVDHTRDLPFALEVAVPAQVGPDRLCNMAAASAAGLSSALVVDVGTATTFDLLLDRSFVGGMIAPGMAFAAEKLGEKAARLEPVVFGPAGWDVGRDTHSAMVGGAWHAGTGGVRAVVAGLLKHYGDLPVIITGGLCGYFHEDSWYVDPFWTMRGAVVLSGLT